MNKKPANGPRRRSCGTCERRPTWWSKSEPSVGRIALNYFVERSPVGISMLAMGNYRKCRAFLMEAFLTLDSDNIEDERLCRAIVLLLEAVARTERDARPSNVVRFSTRPVERKPGA